MSADNRSTHTDALATLGTIINKDEKRDAIHLGVMPVQAGEELTPGDHIGFGPDGKVYAHYYHRGWDKKFEDSFKQVGIVDPFLLEHETIYPRQWIWLVVYPRQITSLRHVWEHPDFPVSELEQKPVGEAEQERLHKMKVLINDPQAMAKEAIRIIAKGLGVEEEELMAHAEQYIKHDNYWVEGGRFEGVSLPQEFWNHYEKVTGKTISNGQRGNFFSCSC